ncbi:MAG TPA: DsrE family protein [Terriglobales bacterium]|nr:DsrE family protein [Terriglobales bacterium]
MKYLFIFNDSPYGSQRTYNGLRLALALGKQNEVGVFLLGDGVASAFRGLNPAHADYNPQEMLRQLAAQGVTIGACRTCLEARGIGDDMLIPEARRSTMDDLVIWTEESEKVLTF